MTSVDEFISRWLAEAKLDCHPSLVSLRLVPHAGEEEPTPWQEAAAAILPPRKALAQAVVGDGSLLVAVFAGHEGMPAAGVDTLLLLCV